MKRTKKDPGAWANTPEGLEKYRQTRAALQKQANETGFDYGLERNDIFKEFTTFLMPSKGNRYGHYLRCEVVSCEILEKCQKGHGPGSLESDGYLSPSEPRFAK